MKKVVVFLSIAIVAFILASCHAKKEAEPLKKLDGQWNIYELNGNKVVTSGVNELPYLVFDATAGQMYGFVGCNRVMGSFDANAQPGVLAFGSLNTTKMTCPDIATEQAIMDALGNVRKFKKDHDDRFALCDASEKPLIILVKKLDQSSLKELKGKWLITSALGTTIDEGKKETQPFIDFDTDAKTFTGNAGCNVINGSFVTVDADPTAISFPNTISTMTSCPEMDIETKIINALNSVVTYTKTVSGVSMFNVDGTEVLTLGKK